MLSSNTRDWVEEKKAVKWVALGEKNPAHITSAPLYSLK